MPLVHTGNPKGNLNEIDIVALKLEKNMAMAAEVKRQQKNFKPELFAKKVEHLNENCCLIIK